VAGPCERGNDPSGSVNCWEILEQLSDVQLLKKGSGVRKELVNTL
jgi:hypothetical protein